MKTLIISTTVAISLLSILIVMAFVAKNPIDALYEAKIEQLMKLKGFSSETEVLDHYPALTEIKTTMQSEAELEYLVQTKTRSPVPVSSEDESGELRRQIKTLNQLRNELKTALKSIKVGSTIVSL